MSEEASGMDGGWVEPKKPNQQFIPMGRSQSEPTTHTDFAKMGKAILDESSIATTASGGEGCATFNSEYSSTGTEGWESLRAFDARRKFLHQASGSSYIPGLPDLDEGEEEGELEAKLEPVCEESAATVQANQEPIKVTSMSDPAYLRPPDLLIAGSLPPVSIGSQEHATGNCKPCAWFWKPESCKNGAECRHCHLCPEGEIKARKTRKHQGAGGLADPAYVNENIGLCSEDVENDIRNGLPSVGARLHASGECRPCAWFYKPQGCSNGRECKHCHMCPEGELKNRKKNAAKKHVEENATAEGENDSSESAMMSAPPGLDLAPVPTAGAMSEGSANHGTGDCRPCAWFWKPNSCLNGKDCLHCHLCPENEIRRRKKDRLKSIQTQSKDATDEIESDNEEEDSPKAADTSPRTPAQQRSAAQGEDCTPPPLSDLLNCVLEGDWPSSGSALHPLGKCKPCAWFWKPGGCTNGKECCHCHICDKLELKGRRRAKETAMKAGALLPAFKASSRKDKTVQSSRNNPNVLMIFPFLCPKGQASDPAPGKWLI